jgi:hypothetical protein
MTRRRKKEEEEWEERLSAGRRDGREEKKEGRRRNKKKKSNVLGCRIILCIFFLCEVSNCDWGAKTPPFTPRPNLSYSQKGIPPLSQSRRCFLCGVSRCFKEPVEESSSMALIDGNISCILPEVHRRLAGKFIHSVRFLLRRSLNPTLTPN